MNCFKNHILLLQLICICNICLSQQVKFRNVLGNVGYDYGMFAQQTFDKGYIVCGSTTSVGNGNTDAYIIKTDSLGKPAKERSIGSSNVDRGTCIKQTADSGYVLLGYTNTPGGPGGYDIFVVKMDADLNTEWEKKYGGSDWDFGNCIEQTSDGGYIICGGTYSYGKGDEDYYIIKTDSNGDTLWTKTYGSNEREEAKSIIQTKDGGYAVTGYSMATDSLGDFYTIKLNTSGDTLWTHTFGGPLLDLSNDIIELHNGGYALAGETKSFGSGKSDGILVEVSSAGITGRTFLVGGTENDNLQSLTERADDKIMFTGVTYSYGYTNGKGDLYFGMLNSNWSFNMSTTFGSAGSESVNSIAATADKGAILCGSTNGFRNFLDDIYLIKTDSTGFSTTSETVLVTRINEENKLNAPLFIVYPNPVQENAYIQFSGSSRSVKIEVIDIMGRVLELNTIPSSLSSSILINMKNMVDGIYFIRITADDTAFSKKIIVKHE
ncbi:MAG TPA: T9SS type A sorting domain-containing protein [Bacteroidia bacterium]|nr:T9SS type A sorting domain-containing protein [Bacteroidia bacterium]